MMVEALVIAACLQNQGGCSESTSAYYESSKEAKAFVQNAEKLGKRMVAGHEWMVYAATPVYAMASGKPAFIHVYKAIVVGVDIKKEQLLLQWSY